MAIALFFSGLYLIVISLMMTGRNLRSSIVLKYIPMGIGILLVYNTAFVVYESLPPFFKT